MARNPVGMSAGSPRAESASMRLEQSGRLALHDFFLAENGTAREGVEDGLVAPVCFVVDDGENARVGTGELVVTGVVLVELVFMLKMGPQCSGSVENFVGGYPDGGA